MCWACARSSRRRTWRGFIAEARRRPGEVTYGTPGVAHIGHLMGELLQSLAGIRLEHIPYRGGADAARDVIGGRIDAAIISESSLQPVFIAGRGRPLASRARGAGPTCRRRRRSQRWCRARPSTWMVIFAPDGTPAPVVNRLAAAFRHATSDPETRRRVEASGTTPWRRGRRTRRAWSPRPRRADPPDPQRGAAGGGLIALSRGAESADRLACPGRPAAHPAADFDGVAPP